MTEVETITRWRDTLERQAERIQKLEAVMLRLLDRVAALEGGRRPDPQDMGSMHVTTEAPLLSSGAALAGVGVVDISHG